MKRLLLISIFLLCVAVGRADNTLTLSSCSGYPGDTVTLTLSLTNSDAVTAMQAFIPLQGQLTYVAGSAALGDRSNGHQLTATVLNDTLRIYSYSLGLNSYTGNSGALLTFRVVLGKEPATYTLPLCSTFLSSSTGSSLTMQTTAGSVTILAPKINLSPSSINYGHCPIRSSYTRSVTVHNIGNEPLTFSGVTFDQNTLSAGEPTIYQIAPGGQQSVTVSYLPVTAGTVTLHGLFHSNANVGDSVLTIAADPYAVNELRPLSVSGYTDSIVTVQLRMNNMDSIVALQTSIKLPEALTYIPGSFAVDGNRSNGHTASAGLIGDTLTMLITNIDNHPLHDGDGVVATFQLQLHGYGYHTLRLLQTVLADSAERNVLSAVYTGTVNIYSPTLNVATMHNMGSTPVTDTAVSAITVRNSGNADLVISQVLFTAPYYSIAETLPLTVTSGQNATLHIRYTGTTAGSFPTLMQIYNNDPRHTLQQVNVACQRYEPNALYMTANADNPVDSATVSVMLDNYSGITALQMDVVYPYNYCTLESGDIRATSRSNGHFVSSARQNDSTWRVLLLSMQNSTLQGNSGPVLELQMHLNDTLDLNQYPLQLHNVMVANSNGDNVLTSLDSITYIATRLQIDTAFIYVHDTTTLYDTVTLIQIDTLTIWDTVTLTQFDTTYLWQYDTTIVNNYIHDTTTLLMWDTLTVTDTLILYQTDTLTIWDTMTVTQYDTTIVNNYIHDTTIVNNYIHDTTYINNYIYDTTYIDNYIHDTTYIDNYIHDTTYINNYIHDTTVVIQHDTVHTTEYIHDTVNNLTYYTLQVTSGTPSSGVAAGSGSFPSGSVVEIAAVPFEGYRFEHWNDQNTDNPRSVTLTADATYTAYFSSVGINNVEVSPTWTLHADRGEMVIRGAMGLAIRIYDMRGTLLYSCNSAGDEERFNVPSSGTYVVQASDGLARKVVVIRN